MKILIADDENLVRIGLESMLEELLPGRAEYLHAANAFQAMALLEERGAPELADSVAQYSRFCARMDGVEEEEKTGAEIYEDLIAGLEGRKPL